MEFGELTFLINKTAMSLAESLSAEKPPEKRLWFTTHYHEANTGGVYGNGLYASSLEDAKNVAAARGLGETIIWRGSGRDWELPSVMLERWSRLYYNNPEFRIHDNFNRALANEAPGFCKLNSDLMHGTVFVGYLAMKSGVASVDEVLSDNGIVHSITHLTMGILDNWQFEPGTKECARMLEKLPIIERRVPGLME